MLSRDNLKSRKGHAGPPIEVPEAQCLGKIEAEYAIIPFTDFGEAVKRAKEFTQPLVAVLAEKTGSLPTKLSFFSIHPEEVGVSAIKMSENNEYVVLRIFNRSDTSKNVEISSFFQIEKAWRTNLKEDMLEELETSGRSIKLSMGPWKIETIAMKIKGPYS